MRVNVRLAASLAAVPDPAWPLVSRWIDEAPFPVERVNVTDEVALVSSTAYK